MGCRGGLLVLVAVGLGQAALAGGNAERGAVIFDGNCADCHPTTEGISNKKGPSLLGIVGRPAAKWPGFDYSDAFKTLNFSWDADTIDKYVTSPKDFVPGNKMRFPGLPIAQERADLIEFLKGVR